MDGGSPGVTERPDVSGANTLKVPKRTARLADVGKAALSKRCVAGTWGIKWACTGMLMKVLG